MPNTARNQGKAANAAAHSFEIPYSQFLNSEGKVVGSLPEFAKDAKKLIPLYRAMVLTRTFDAKAAAMQRTGRLGTYASSLGQEAVGVGFASAMIKEDILCPSFREQGAMLWRGVGIDEIYTYWGGDERGSDFRNCPNDFPICVPVGTQSAHATGAAHAMKLKGQKACAVSVIGDGGTSKGDFYEALNMAGAWELPVVFIITNNQWAISVPREQQSNCETLAQKAIAGGIPGEQVDGNDVIAVKAAAERAMKKARSGGGAHVIECITYRLSDHTTADDATKYRDPKEVSKAWKNDPVARLRTYLGDQKVWTKKDEEKLLQEVTDEVDKAVQLYMNKEPQSPLTMFDHLYETLPPSLEEQRELLAERIKSHG